MQSINTDLPAAQNEALIHSLWDIHHKMRHIHDGKASQSRILIILQERGTMTQRAMTEHLHIRPGSASEIITKLERNGLLKRCPNEHDHRTVNLLLTEKGGRLAQEAAEQRRRLHGEMFACLTAEEKETLYTVLGKLQADWQERFPRCAEKSGE